MPEEILQEENPIYKFMKSNNLTDLNEGEFLTKYSAPNKAKEIHSFMVSNKLTDLDESKFYDSYLKKKDQGILPSVSSPTQSLSPDFKKGKAFAEKGFLMKPEGTKEEIIETPDSQQQGLLLNLVSSLDKGFAKNFISSPIKGLGTVLQGTTKKVLGGTGEGYISDKLIKLGDYLNNAIDEVTPQDEEFKNTLWDQAGQAVGQIGSLVLTGGLTGAAGKGAALVSQAPKGAAITAVKTLGSQLSSPTAISAGLSMGQAEFDRAIQAGATDDQAFEAFYKNAVTGSVLETVPVMQFFKRFNKSTAGSVANYIKTKGVAGLTGGIEEMTTEVMQQIYANKTAKDIYNINQDILDGVGSSGGIGFGIGFLLNAMGANAKILRKQGKVQEADVLENQVKQYEDNLENPKVTSGNKVSAKDIVTQGPEIGTQKAVRNLDRDLANNVITPEQHQEGVVFVEKAAQVADKIPETVTGESRVKSVELLVERNDIKQANDNLIQQKQITDEAYHAGIDEEIKANEEKIKKVDAEVYNIAKKPSKEFGTKKYEVDGEEVTKEAFEALQGKPLGTKTVVKAEVKPEEVKVTEEVKPAEEKDYNTLYHNSTAENLKLEDIDLLRKGQSQLKKSMKNLPEELQPSGFYTTDDVMSRFMGGTNKYSFKFPKNAKVKDLAAEGRVTDRLSKKELVDLRNQGYDIIKGKNMAGQQEFIPLNKELIKDWKYEGPNIKKENEKYYYTKVTPEGPVQIEVPENIYKSIEKNRYEQVKEEVKVKAPTKELAEGESVEFKTPEGNKIVGEKVIIPGFEKMDLVLVKDGFENKIYELASGIEMGGTQEAFSKEAAIESLRKAMEGKKITSDKVHNVIFKGENVKQINPSKKFESYSEERKTKERSDYESLPLKFTPKEIERLQELKKKAIEYGIDKKVKEIEDAISSRAKEGTFKPNTDYFEKILQADIDRKIKKEAEQNKVPYPKEYIQKFPDVTEDYLKTMVNSGYKVDKFAKIPTDVKNIMIDGLQLNRDFVNKYGYHPYEQSDIFFTKLLYFMNSLGARENKDARAITAKKELTKALDDLNKVYEKEFGKKAEAEVKPKEEVIEPDLKKAEAKFAAAEDKLKKARNKIEATQVKQAGIFGGEQKGMFAMGGEEAKSTLEPLRKAAKEAKAELDNVRNKVKVQEQAQPELAPTKAIVKPTEKQISNLTKELLRVNYTGADLKAKSEGTPGKVGYVQSAEDWYREIAKEYLENDISIVEVVDDLHGGKERVQSIINGEEAPKKTYQEALKEKLDAEKKLTKKIAGEKAGVTRNIIKEASKIEPSDARSAALKYLAGGNLSWEAIDEVAGNVKKARLNTGERELKSEEARSRDYVAKKGQGDDLDDAVHFIWSELHGISEELSGIEDTEIKNALMQAISEYPSKVEAAQALIDGYKEVNLEDQEAAFYERNQGEEGQENVNEKLTAEKFDSEKVKEEFKEVIGKASKKAKENAKIDFVDRNFEYLKEKIKIEEKCPF